ncbi:hypothetical protein KK062_03940 [Fulvivirgaceae bacterium PWU5]|uniref:Uncharacterized protein n=1 Tax=Dawidia cretensis TaxID=2782350 RepID=A0AAP2DTY1_9BACT|nr:hypothetical protein [Dawidia cretensis]MBT1707356.1 hypothetical protein [Dawidia cretensis]
MSITAKLTAFEKQLELIKAPVIKYLLPGLAKEEIHRRFATTGLTPTDDLVTLYQWRNGLRYDDIPTGMLLFGIGGVLLPLQDSVTIYNRTDFELKKNYFPVFQTTAF